MLLVQPKYFEILTNITDPSKPEGLRELGEILQLTLQLEHATIPPYLSAAYSLTGSNNRPISELILRIAKEEMLHMTVIANIMNAIGVSPKLNDPEFIPAYPAPLPLLDSDGWQVGLKSFSKDIDASKALIKDTFMRIEAPEDPLMFPDLDDGVFLASAVSLGEAPRTIGALYESIISVLESGAIPNLFGNTENSLYKQVTTEGLLLFRFRPVQLKKEGLPEMYPLPDGITFKITDRDSAVRHLRWVMEQGEGTDTQPKDAAGLPAHYYRFESIIYEEYLIENPDVAPDDPYDGGYAFDGAPLVLDLNGVHEFDPNPVIDNYPEGDLREAMEKFQAGYRDMLAKLDSAFNPVDDSPEALEMQRSSYYGSISAMRGMSRDASLVIRSAGAVPGALGGLVY
ncbi:MAG: ferritin-like protein [Aphanothece saxicola GSE-SYN-MK-01-06B]|jgi:rubrerythrin|nr:ferritin-like protein [Aphanothece saxicola GSE-SYN-MK-01-06B]